MNFVRNVSRKAVSAVSVASLVFGALVATTTAANAAAPSNNDFASATVLNATSPTLTGQTNAEATVQTNEYVGTRSGANAWSKTVWYSWTPTASGSSTIDICTAGFKSVIAVYANPGALPTTTPGTANIAENTGCSGTNGAKLTVTVASGTTYLIQIGGNSGGGINSGVFTLNISAPGATPVPTYTLLDRVTICHRTHATTNPYRIITVSASSIVKADNTINGHGKHATDARRYDPTLYGVFDSTKTYKANAKLWGDIIPPFKDATTGGVFNGLNWYWDNPVTTDTTFDKTEFGSVTVDGTNATAQAAVDLCKGSKGQLTAKQYFELERKSGEKRKDILDEIKETDDLEADPNSKESGPLEKELPAREGPKSEPTNPIAQSLSGNVWLDINRNGFQEDNEPDMANIRVAVNNGEAPVAMGGAFAGFGTGRKYISEKFGFNPLNSALDYGINQFGSVITSIRSLLGMATSYVVYTDKNGYYIFKNLASGAWYATGSVPDGLGVTYDSSGVSDATADTVVPAGGHAFTWIGLVGDESTGIKSTVKNPDGSLATKQVVLTSAGTDGKFCSADDVNYVLTPVNGVIEMTGITAGNYYIRQIGDTATLGDLTIVSGQIYSTTINTKAGMRCPVLAATGAGGVDTKSALALLLVVLGLVATVAGQASRRKYKATL